MQIALQVYYTLIGRTSAISYAVFSALDHQFMASAVLVLIALMVSFRHKRNSRCQVGKEMKPSISLKVLIIENCNRHSLFHLGENGIVLSECNGTGLGDAIDSLALERKIDQDQVLNRTITPCVVHSGT